MIAACYIRWMLRRDMDDVCRTERLGTTGPWSIDDMLCVLRQRNAIGMVCVQDDKIVGHMAYELHKTHLRLLRIATAPAARRTGVGSAMIAKLKLKLYSHRRDKIIAEVCEKLTGAHLFFKSHGFKAVGVTGGEEAMYKFVFKEPS